MLVFRSFSLIALAFATFSSAVPFDARDVAAVARDNAVSAGVVARTTLGVGDHYNKCNGAITSTITQIEQELAAKIINNDIIISLLQDIDATLNILLVDLNGLLGAGSSEWGLCNGEIISVAAIAAIVFDLLKLVVDILCVVIKVIAFLDLQAVIVSIGSALSAVLQITFEIIADIQIILAGLSIALLGNLSILGFLDLCNLLGLKL